MMVLDPWHISWWTNVGAWTVALLIIIAGYALGYLATKRRR
jgi:uncharacterized membrane protein